MWRFIKAAMTKSRRKGTDSVVLKPTKRPVAGDTITVTAPTNYLKVKHSKFGETILYLPDKYLHLCTSEQCKRVYVLFGVE